jgi:hypothetical protein
MPDAFLTEGKPTMEILLFIPGFIAACGAIAFILTSNA